ncbi:MAG: DUF4838 domain-containing protein [Fimbriimonadales bacterium]
MKRLVLCVSLLAFLAVLANSETVVAKTVVVSQLGATPAEVHAAQELRDHLAKITGVDVPLRTGAVDAPRNAIVVGQGLVARKLFAGVQWGKLGEEQTLIRSKRDVLLVAGGQPRGTLYAVYRLLQVKCGVRWWTPWATTIPKNPKLAFGAMDWTETPAFEYRDPYWFHSFDADWAARNFDNGFNTRVDAARGGKVLYQGFVHTYYGLAPPDKLFGVHPEWFSLINGRRTTQDAQLCTTNPQLRDYIVEQVRAQLKANPKARIVSVSQNDCFNPCQCPTCRALAAQEGSDSALVLDLANYVGEKIEKEFPNVAVDTLAYQWSRHPTKTMRPRKNVIVRLCSIECNFAFPLGAPQNASFGDDIRGWSKLTNRLYIWDYCTNFANYMQPHPDYFTLGPTIQWFSQNGVKGVFEEGDYSSNGGDMAELKAWLIAQMLWDPKQDPDKLVDEFLAGYYGPKAAPIIKDYLSLMAKAAQSVHLSFALGTQTPFLRYEVMKQAQFQWAEAWATADTPNPSPYGFRILQGMMSPNYVFLRRWREFRSLEPDPSSWFGFETRSRLADSWLECVTQRAGLPRQTQVPDGWSPITAVSEGGTTPRAFIASLGPEPALPVFHPLPPRGINPVPPAGLPEGIDFQDDLASLWQAPDNSELRADPLASDGIACWMPGSHHEWAFQVSLSKKPVTGRYKVYVIVRLDHDAPDASAAFSAGVYDNLAKKDLTTMVFQLNQVAASYKAYELGTFDVKPELTVWVAPPSNPKVKAVWVDRVYLVKEQ